MSPPSALPPPSSFVWPDVTLAAWAGLDYGWLDRSL